MKTIVLTLLTAFSLFAATPEQVERYISLSNTDEQLVELEREFATLQENLHGYANDNEVESYDMQLLSIRFKEYLQKHLSEDEMNEILSLYRNTLLLRFVSATAVSAEDIDEENRYINTLESLPDKEERMRLVKKINKAMYTSESMKTMYDNLARPLFERISGKKLNSKHMEEDRKAFIKSIQKENEGAILYATRDFTTEELEALLKLAKEPAIRKEVSAVYEATAYALKAFFHTMAGRYNTGIHQTRKATDKP